MHRAHSIFYSFLSANDDDDSDDHGNYDDLYVMMKRVFSVTKNDLSLNYDYDEVFVCL